MFIMSRIFPNVPRNITKGLFRALRARKLLIFTMKGGVSTSVRRHAPKLGGSFLILLNFWTHRIRRCLIPKFLSIRNQSKCF